MVAILEALRFYISTFGSKLVVESDSQNVISWVSSSVMPLWRFQFYLNEIKMLSPYFGVVFQHVGQIKGWTNLFLLLPMPCSLLSFPFDNVVSFFILLGKGRILLYVLFSLPSVVGVLILWINPFIMKVSSTNKKNKDSQLANIANPLAIPL